jgi:hypothetical protein
MGQPDSVRIAAPKPDRSGRFNWSNQTEPVIV